MFRRPALQDQLAAGDELNGGSAERVSYRFDRTAEVLSKERFHDRAERQAILLPDEAMTFVTECRVGHRDVALLQNIDDLFQSPASPDVVHSLHDQQRTHDPFGQRDR